MEEGIRNALIDEILSEFENLKTLKPGSKEYEAAVDNITKLYKLELEETKVDADWKSEQTKKDQLTEQTRERYLRLAVDVAGIILPLVFYATWMKKGFKFEETGTFTSTTFRGLFNRFRPTTSK